MAPSFYFEKFVARAPPFAVVHDKSMERLTNQISSLENGMSVAGPGHDDLFINGLNGVPDNPICDQVFSEAYDCVVKLACPLLPRDCQIEIIKMIVPTTLSLSVIQEQSRAQEHRKGVTVTLLPEAKKVNQPYSISHTEKELYDLRRCFNINFHFSDLHLSDIDPKSLFYFICAFGTEENYEKFICLSTFRPEEAPPIEDYVYHHQAIYIALKYGNIQLILYLLKMMSSYKNHLTEELPKIYAQSCSVMRLNLDI